MIMILAAFITVQTADGREAAINPDQIASIQYVREDGEGNKMLVDKVRCVLGMTTGKFISVVEECDEVLRKIEGTPP